MSDHDITGLIGRPKETKDLEKYLSNPRIGCISIVAPGGVGKTALAIDALDKVCKKPDFNELFEAVVFLSLKLEKLTASGIEILDAPSTINEIEEELIDLIPSVLQDTAVSTFEELKKSYKDRHLLIFIDNLETLLRDSPTAFDEFQIDLPVNWRVLVTSRVNVNSATCLPIETLSDQNAKHLIRLYATRRNASELVKDEIVEKILVPTRCNPLAIRLTVDAYILGSSLEFSVDVASRDVINFSYTNLLDVIGKESIAVLECLFIQDTQTRVELSENLNSSIDVIAKGLHELTRTSLISRDSTKQQEVYSLYPSIRDLLLVSPRNPTLRAEVQKRVLKRRELAIGGDKKQASLPISHPDYVHNDLPAIVRDVLFQSNKVYKNLGKPNTQDETLRHIDRMRSLKNEFPKIACIPRFIAKIYCKLGDNATARIELLEALRIDADDIQALILMGRVEQNLANYQDAFLNYKKIVDKYGWKSESIDEQTTRVAAIGYLLNQLYIGDYKGILDSTIDSEKYPHIKDVLGVYRARAWKRSTENLQDSEEKATALNKATNMLEKVSKEFGHPEWTHGTFHEVIEEIVNQRPIFSTNQRPILSTFSLG